MMKIVGMRIEKYVGNCGYSDFEEPDSQLMDRYIIYAIGKYHNKYEITIWDEDGMCGSGWCSASWGNIKVKRVNGFGNITHTPIKELTIDDLEENVEGIDVENEVFYVNYDGGDSYYLRGGINVHIELFKETNRSLEKRPVWLFIGESNIGKSYLAHKLDENTMEVYETDSSETLPKIITQNIIVKGNKYDFSIEDIKNRIFEEHELIIVKFDKL